MLKITFNISLPVPLPPYQNRQRKYLVLLACLLLLLTSCGTNIFAQSDNNFSQAPSSSSSSQGIETAQITLKLPVSYPAILQTFTNLGLHPAELCSPTEPQTYKDMFNPPYYPHHNTMALVSSPLAPPDWFGRVKGLPYVIDAVGDPEYSCGDGSNMPPITSQVDSYARITFSTNDYETALYNVSVRGIRLADPCLEHKPPTTWHPVGQEVSFKKTSTLIVALTSYTPARWQQKLHDSGVVSKIEIPYTAQC